MTTRLTVAQAIVRFLEAQYVERDGAETPFFAGCWGIFGHGNVAGVGQACSSARARRTTATRRPGTAALPPGPQRAGHGARRRRLRPPPRPARRVRVHAPRSVRAPPTWSPAPRSPPSTGSRCCCCPATSSRPGSPTRCSRSSRTPRRTTSASTTPSSRCRGSGTGSTGPSSCPLALLAAMRVLTDPAETGAVTLSLPQDVQAEAWDWPRRLFAARVWHVTRQPVPSRRPRPRRRPDPQRAQRPLIVAGGGVLYARRERRARAPSPRRPASRWGRPRQARAVLPFDHPQAVGAIGATGTTAANALAARGRPRDRHRHPLQRLHHRPPGPSSRTPTSGSSTSTSPSVDAHKLVARSPCVGDARDGPRAARPRGSAAGRLRADHTRARHGARPRVGRHRADAAYDLGHGPLPAQSEVIGAVNRLSTPRDVVVCAAGSMPGDLHKTVAHAGPQGLPRRVRLLLHGLRDRRRARRQDGRPRHRRGPRRRGDGRRRLLPDDARRSSSPPCRRASS